MKEAIEAVSTTKRRENIGTNSFIQSQRNGRSSFTNKYTKYQEMQHNMHGAQVTKQHGSLQGLGKDDPRPAWYLMKWYVMADI